MSWGGGVQEHDFPKKLAVQPTPSMCQENGSVKTPSVNDKACERKTVIHRKKIESAPAEDGFGVVVS